MAKCALLLLLPLLLHADFQAGLDAYIKGDFAAAEKEWRPIAERGDANAQYNLGLLYARGEGLQRDPARAAEWYRKAAEQGVAAAQYNLGLLYSTGQGVPRDYAEAERWFRRAAEQGVAGAENSLGNVFSEGEGSFRNPTEAERWYRKAAERGIASAQFNLAVMHDLGQGIPRNFEEAFTWYQRAAEQGHPGAMTNLGILYYNAQGAKRDLVQAYAWFARAARAREQRAATLLKITANRLKKDQVREAEQLAAAWSPKPVEVKEETTVLAEAKPAPATAQADRQTPAAPQPVAAPQSGAAPQPVSADDGVRAIWPAVERVVAVGDVHGDYEQFWAALASAGLIDGSGAWTGGRAHLVQTGDILDRGPDSRKVMDLLISLEQQAEKAGGKVHVLLGNHEAMNLYGDLRYVSPGEFASYMPELTEPPHDSGGRLVAQARPAQPGAAGLAGQPGFAEHRAALNPEGYYGKWLANKNAAIKIGGTLFVHAGIGPKYASWPLARLNAAIRGELRDPAKLSGGVATDEQGPLWHRGLTEGADAAHIDRLLQRHGAERIVVGHDYADAAITPRFGGRVLMIDIGLPRVYDNIGKLGVLVIENGRPYALHRGKRIELPRDEGPDLLRYLKQAAAADPQPSPLAARIEALEKRGN